MGTRINIKKEELMAVAEMLRDSLPACEGATVLKLQGDLGVGKTALVQHLAGALGVEEVVSSPTFVLQKIYSTKHHRFSTLVHIDLYRLHTSTEVEVLQLEQWVGDSQVLLCVEWPDRVVAWPGAACVYEVFLSEVSDTERLLRIPELSLPLFL